MVQALAVMMVYNSMYCLAQHRSSFFDRMNGAYEQSGKWVLGYDTSTAFVWNSFMSTLNVLLSLSETVIDDTTTAHWDVGMWVIQCTI